MSKHDPQGRMDRLEMILEVASNLKHTGLCNVERGKGGVRQFGKLVYLDGLLVDASSDALEGPEAWKWLKTWSFCHYVFVSKSREEIRIPVLPDPQSDELTAPASPLGVLSQVIERVADSISKNLAPALKLSSSVTQPLVPSSESLSLNQAPYQCSFSATDTIVDTPKNTNIAHFSPFERGSSLDPNSDQRYSLPLTPLPPPPPPPAHSVHVPSRLLDGDEALSFIEEKKLSRQHRRIFFLLDGRRTITDIVRLTRRSCDEVQYILQDLEQFGLIENVSRLIPYPVNEG